MIEAQIKKHYDTVTLPTMGTGATDMAQIRSKGVQCYGIGPALDSEDGQKGFGAHSDQERILVERTAPLRALPDRRRHGDGAGEVARLGARGWGLGLEKRMNAITLTRCHVVVLMLCLVLSACSTPPPAEPPYDLVIANGRVIDPESGLDAVRHVGIRGGTIAALSATPLAAGAGHRRHRPRRGARVHRPPRARPAGGELPDDGARRRHLGVRARGRHRRRRRRGTPRARAGRSSTSACRSDTSRRG